MRKAQPAKPGLRRKIEVAALVLTAVTALAYVGIVAGDLSRMRQSYGDVALTHDVHEVPRDLGRPSRIEDDGHRQVYETAGRTLTLRLDDRRKVIEVACGASVVLADACPLVGDIGLGSPESVVFQELGRPSSESEEGGAKVLHYPGFGYTLRLSRGTVQAITHGVPAGVGPYVSALLWRLLP